MTERSPFVTPDDTDREQADLLDRYSDELGTGGAVQPDGLAPELAALARRIHERSAAAVPATRFEIRLRSQLEAAWKPREAALDHPRRRSWLRTTRRTLAGLVAAGLTAVAVVGILLVSGREDALSGADVLRVAQAAAETPTTSGVTSFEMTVAHWRLPRNSDHTLDLSGEREPNTYQTRMWFEAPDRRRLDWGDGFSVWDGTTFWLSLWRDEYQAWPQADMMSPNWLSPGDRVGLPAEGDAQSPNASDAGCYEGRIADDEVIAGRQVHVVELDSSNCASEDPEIGRRVVWVDRETGFVLKSDAYAASDDDLLVSRTEVAHVEYNVPIAPDRFTFTPPPGAELQVDPAAVGAHVTELDSLAEAEARATFDVSTPGDMPVDFTLDRIRHAWPAYTTQAQRADASLAADWLELRYARPDGGWIEISEGYSRRYYSWLAVTPPADRGTTLVDGRQAYWVEGTPPPTVVDRSSNDADIAAVFWPEERGPYERRYVVVASNVLTVEELTALAESLE